VRARTSRTRRDRRRRFDWPAPALVRRTKVACGLSVKLRAWRRRSRLRRRPGRSAASHGRFRSASTRLAGVRRKFRARRSAQGLNGCDYARRSQKRAAASRRAAAAPDKVARMRRCAAPRLHHRRLGLSCPTSTFASLPRAARCFLCDADQSHSECLKPQPVRSLSSVSIREKALRCGILATDAVFERR
jgi:hypothetical protein